jgi:glycosyltransferase involved in cell wall biosynthesis
VKREVKDAKFWVVGRNPPRSIRKFSDDDIVVTGSVDDVRPYYAKASVAVAPFEFGGGTKLKILEALSSNVPMVSTSIGAQGLDVKDEVHLLIRDDWTNFQESLVRLLNDFNLWKKLAVNGRKFVETYYSWDVIIKNFIKTHQDILS